MPTPKAATATVGLLMMRSYVLSGDTAHYDAVIRALEARGLHVLPAFAGGLDGRPAIETFFVDNGIDPTGLGEPSLPPISGALANAMYQATGTRYYHQPFVGSKQDQPIIG